MNDYVLSMLRATGFLAGSSAIVWVALKSLRIRSARIHQLAWSLVLLQGVLLFPVPVRVPVLSQSLSENGESAASGFAVQAETPREMAPAGRQSQSGDDRREQPAESVTHDSRTGVAPIAAMDTSAVLHNSPSSERLRPAVGSRPVDAQLIRGLPSGFFVLALIWGSGFVGLLFCSAWTYAGFLRELAHATAAPEIWQTQWKRLLMKHTRCRAEMLCHETLGPMLCRTPTRYKLVVPEELWENLSAAQRDAILRHELAHLERRDIWTSVVARMIAAVHWFNPGAWLAVRQFDEAAEWACDERAVGKSRRQAPEFANALLKLVPAGRPVFGTSSVQGSPIGVRIRRIVASHPTDALWRRGMVFLMLAALLVCGSVQISLTRTTHAALAPLLTQQQESIEQRIQNFAGKISSTTELARTFVKVIQQPAGRIALTDQTEWIEQRMRSEARGDTTTEWIADVFEQKDGRYTFRADDPQAKNDFLHSVKRWNDQANDLEAAMTSVAKSIKAESGRPALVKRFLTTKNASYVLYAERFRRIFAPDERFVAEFLQEWFVRDVDGRYRIRQAYAAEAEDVSDRLMRVARGNKLLAPELASYGAEFVTAQTKTPSKRDINTRLAGTFQSPQFATMLSLEMLYFENEPVRERINGFFEEVEEITRDTARGLVVSTEGAELANEWLSLFQRVSRVHQTLEPALMKFVKQIKPTSELEQRLKQLLGSRTGSVWMAWDVSGAFEGIDFDDPDLMETLVRREFGLQEPDGEEFDDEEFSEGLEDLFAQVRRLRRDSRAFSELAAKGQPTVSNAFATPAGTLAAFERIESMVNTRRFDALGIWISEHFEETDNGWMPREQATDAMTEVIESARRIEQELENDDF